MGREKQSGPVTTRAARNHIEPVAILTPNQRRRNARLLDDLLGVVRPDVDVTLSGDYWHDTYCDRGVEERELAGAL